jgi:hypothetical protein
MNDGLSFMLTSSKPLTIGKTKVSQRTKLAIQYKENRRQGLCSVGGFFLSKCKQIGTRQSMQSGRIKAKGLYYPYGQKTLGE